MQMALPLFAVGARTPFLRSTQSWKFRPAVAACISGMGLGFTTLVQVGVATGDGDLLEQEPLWALEQAL